MADLYGTALWKQFGAAIDTLGRVLQVCPEHLWAKPVWPETPPEWFPRSFPEFWYVGYHTLVWLDLYLAGAPEEEFAPPPPFLAGEVDSPATTPERPYSKEQLSGYLATLRERCRDTLTGLSEDQAGRLVDYPWCKGERVTYAELLLYNLRHLQGHTAELGLFLGQHGLTGEELGWATRAPD